MSLTEANLRAHDNVATWGAPSQKPPLSASVQGTTRSTAKDSRRPSDCMGSIVGFGPSPSLRTNAGRGDNMSSAASSSKCVAVGHGSVRPPPSRCSSATDRAASESLAIESLEMQLDEERRIRKTMESRIENLSTMIERLSVAAPSPAPDAPRAAGGRKPSAHTRERKVTFQAK
ncbi:Hypothetical protein, putative [Bodo saltans]|uniref:Uncharacterized protein n=1 Tax=Bodo saltans TaxID=75058 RepID=A0A0S4JIP3_BODSA|nr:Hypothetical protein, putative [Bodo saltans]|eukprot:CUG88866.1 Hypothetical protein, putative [Bodo saltans]